MLVHVKKPHIEVTIKGDVPERYLKFLRKDFGDDLKVEDEETINIDDWPTYQEFKKNKTVGGAIKFHRTMRKLTQTELGKLLGDRSKTYISDLENNRVDVSKNMAKALAKIFSTSLDVFIR